MFGFLAQSIAVGAHAVGLVTHTNPAIGNKALTEGYLTQPAIMADASFGPFQFAGMVNFEGLTLRRGELNHGVYGEGYVDRRHPHTYVHEAVLTIQPNRSRWLSVSAGRGFAPYGTDDPMVRPFVKYPANHHLSQILERLFVSGALHVGPAIVEGGLFNGTEPVDPEDMGDVDTFGDSWSARATLLPVAGLELQASYAEVTSPENPMGEGLDHKMWNASIRFARESGGNRWYVLVEGGKTSEGLGNTNFFHYSTVLTEGTLQRSGWRVAARYERTVRPEEERTVDLFRGVRPHTAVSILGTTRWDIGSAQLARSMKLGKFNLAPFIEAARLHARPQQEFPVVVPENFYGSDTLWSFSFGIRSTIGMWHDRMGRYGAARVQTSEHHH
jgi:hypothetical protein